MTIIWIRTIVMMTPQKTFKLSLLLTLLTALLTSIGVQAQNARKSLPMNIFTYEGIYELTVPDTQTTRSAYGGKLRIYDAHIAKMFEVTYQDCLQFPNAAREWYYYAGNGNINMGTFYITCDLARDIVSAYGLGTPQNTKITFDQGGGDYGPPRTENLPIPTLNLNGGKEQKWINFAKNFKPVSR